MLAVQALCAAGVPALARRRRRANLAILMFHGVEAEPPSQPCGWINDAATFRRQLDYLRKHFNVLPLEEALERLSADTLPDRAVTLTFDDGTRNLATQAAPALRDAGLSGAVFLATGPMGTDEALWPDRLWLAFARTQAPEIDLTQIGLGIRSIRSAADRSMTCMEATERLKDLPDADRIARLESLLPALGQTSNTDAGPFQLLSWDEARAMASGGHVTLYPHSVTHPILSNCPDDKLEREISESCAALERETGRLPAVFAYPNGRTQDFDERAKALLSRRGVRWALATTKGLADRNSDPLALPRISIGGDVSFAAFKLFVSGFAAT